MLSSHLRAHCRRAPLVALSSILLATGMADARAAPTAGALPVSTPGAPTDWPQFRGPAGMPVSDHPDLPLVWSQSENVEWMADVPGMGWSSPIVSGSTVFVTAATSDTEMKQPSLGVDFSNDYVAELSQQGVEDEELMRQVTERDNELPHEIRLSYRLLAYDLESGALRWDREIYTGSPPVGRHRKNSYTSETPVTDGEAVYVYVAHLGLYAFDFAGNPLWSTALEPRPVYLDFGGGSSPALHGNRIFILNDNQEASYLAAFDKRSGARIWTVERAGLGNQMLRSAWSTPFVWTNDQRTEIVTSGPLTSIGYDLDGGELWRMNRHGLMAIATPFAWDGHVYISSGSGGGGDRPITAIRPGAQGDITPAESETSNEHVLWYERVAGGTYLPTPLVYDGGLYVLTEKGIFSRLDPKTGARTYRTRIHPTAQNFTSSPWAYNGHILCINEEGDTFVIKSGETFELAGVNSLDEFTQATPAISGDRLLIRTQGRLDSIRAGSS